ncbi:MAG: hypothetical protein IPH96_18040 [Saprospiraceae bacterium]|nr:hypothetical protein [Saprospiraceae bacterium]
MHNKIDADFPQKMEQALAYAKEEQRHLHPFWGREVKSFSIPRLNSSMQAQKPRSNPVRRNSYQISKMHGASLVHGKIFSS